MNPFRVYPAAACGADGYPLAWHDLGNGKGVKHLVREEAGHRCVRCLHPFVCGSTPGAWSPCDARCVHDGPVRVMVGDEVAVTHDRLSSAFTAGDMARMYEPLGRIEASARVLTVHHLRLGHDAKRDLRWWNLAALCQRDHLYIQGKVQMDRVWPWEHSAWFKPYAAGFYAWRYLGEELSREETMARLDELLGLELAA